MNKALDLLASYKVALAASHNAAEAVCKDEPNAILQEKVAFQGLIKAREAFTPELVRELCKEIIELQEERDNLRAYVEDWRIEADKVVKMQNLMLADDNIYSRGEVNAASWCLIRKIHTEARDETL